MIGEHLLDRPDLREKRSQATAFLRRHSTAIAIGGGALLMSALVVATSEAVSKGITPAPASRSANAPEGCLDRVRLPDGSLSIECPTTQKPEELPPISGEAVGGSDSSLDDVDPTSPAKTPWIR